MIVLALDVGKKRIGMALSDPLGVIATGIPTLERQTLAWDLEQIQKIASERKVQRIVLGLPLHLDGRMGKEAQEMLVFKDEIHDKTRLPVEMFDERWTTVQAEKSLLEGDLSRKKRKERIDRIAAQLILQGYLERMRSAV